MVPIAVDSTLVEVRKRMMPGAVDLAKAARGRGEQPVRLADLDSHPLQSADSMIEDMWVCGQMQKALTSPAFEVGPLARRFESMLMLHQRNVLDFVSYD